MWITIALLLAIATFQNKQGVANKLIVLSCVIMSLAQLYWIFEL